MRNLPPTLASLDLRSAKPSPKKADAFYLSAEWRALVDRLRRERPNCCALCARTKVRLFADHIIELADGGSRFDPMNVMLICGSCHTRKTAAARARRMTQTY
jgi:5-methylcytosine-specific restriction protein A